MLISYPILVILVGEEAQDLALRMSRINQELNPTISTLEFEVESQIQIMSPVLEQFLFLSHNLG